MIAPAAGAVPEVFRADPAAHVDTPGREARFVRFRGVGLFRSSKRALRPQHLVGVPPRAADEPRNAPEDAERLDRAGRFDAAQVLDVPPELLEDLLDVVLGAGVVATDEHRG